MFASPYRSDLHGGGYTEYVPMSVEEWSQHAFETLRALRGILVAEREEASFVTKPAIGELEKAVIKLLDAYQDDIRGDREMLDRYVKEMTKKKKSETGK